MQIDSGSEANYLRVNYILKIDNRPPLKACTGEGVSLPGCIYWLEVKERERGSYWLKMLQAHYCYPDQQVRNWTLSVKTELLVNSVFDARELSKDEVLLEYSNVFTGFGGTFSTFANPIIHFFYRPPPQFCLMIVFDFSWNMKMTQEISKTMAMPIFFWGGG